MIVGRAIANLRRRDWASVAIELLVVVIGVFIGLQVDNWNQSRHDAARARENLQRIETDLAIDQAALQRRVVFWRQVTDYGHGAIRYAETGQRVDGSAWKTLLSFYQASQLFPYVPADTTYQELRSAGELRLFADPDLRTALADYYVNGAGYAANFLFRLEPEYRKLVRGHTPTIASAQVWAHCHQTPAPDQQRLIACDSPMSEAQAQTVLDGYLADPNLLPELRFWITNLEVMTELVSQHQVAARALAERLHKEFGA